MEGNDWRAKNSTGDLFLNEQNHCLRRRTNKAPREIVSKIVFFFFGKQSQKAINCSQLTKVSQNSRKNESVSRSKKNLFFYYYFVLLFFFRKEHPRQQNLILGSQIIPSEIPVYNFSAFGLILAGLKTDYQIVRNPYINYKLLKVISIISNSSLLRMFTPAPIIGSLCMSQTN